MAAEDPRVELRAERRLSRRGFFRGSLAIVGAGVSTTLLAACGGAPASAPPAPSKPAAPEKPAQAPPVAAPAPTAVASKPAAPEKPSQAPAAATSRTVSLRFNWTMKGEFTPFLVAREKGFYKAQNIEVDLGEGKSGTQAVQVVGAGNDQFGYVPSIQVIQGINQGIPIRSIATLGRNTGMCWASRGSVPLDGPKALEGRKVSISTQSTFFQVWEAFARKFNVDKSKVDVVQADPSARVGLFLNNQVDIMADIFVANDYVILQKRINEPLNMLKMADLDFDPVGYLLVANRSVLDADKGLVRGFIQASLEGFRFTLEHPDEATAIVTKLHGDQLGAEVLDGQVKNLLTLISREPTLGKAEKEPWDRSLAILQEAGVIDKRLGHDEYYTNEFVGG